MAQAAVVLTLIAATLIGPCLCCCAGTRTFSQSTQTAQTDFPVAPACPHCRTPAGPPSAEHPVPADREHTCPNCDCRAFRTAVAPAPPTPDPGLPFVALLPVVADVSVDTVSRTRPTAFPPDRGIRAFLLDACHRLRC